MLPIQSISIKPFGNGRRCYVRVNGVPMDFVFTDLVEFSQGVERCLAITERLVPTNALRPDDRTFLELESIYVEDASEYNRRSIAAREVRERADVGQKVAGGLWYMEINMNGTSTDCSFNGLSDLLQLVQGVIKREMANNGVIARASTITEMRVAH
jgi:hypothetical protein